ncbi:MULTISPECIES: hypothetical protein [Afipia]|jgi:hypothetical protein|uniref:hypothetical protein n=1 Tax=Afipia TaxID=1033 RepID=UPI0002EE41E3|nr:MULTISPECIES: hypothetical protein [Afipia]RTL74213.1 MAG: hypothetical protein EKK36_10960 [Bradyrhizobiaceae bacterium]
MKFFVSACGVAAALLFLVPSANAAPKGKSREECLALAQQRGFNGGGTMGGKQRAEFVGKCMHGKAK